ncbi:hypothetical protein GBAR_LOCUS26751, partial [Geodia barretti]
MSRISINDFLVLSPTDYRASRLLCESQRTQNYISLHYGCLVGDGSGPVTCAREGPQATPDRGRVARGWVGRSGQRGDYRVYSLQRRLENAEEGYFNCVMEGDINPLSGLFVLHPITAVTAFIEVEAGTLTFRVRCTSTGGRAL